MKLASIVEPLSVRSRMTRQLIRCADAARDRRQFELAAALYGEVIELSPRRAGVHIQLGHMLKEAGDFDAAERAYREAERLRPDDADLALQLGHLYKVFGHRNEAEQAYREALRRKPNWDLPGIELDALTNDAETSVYETRNPDRGVTDLAPDAAAFVAASTLVSEIAPRKPIELLRRYAPGIELRQRGRRERTPWGILFTLRGIEAIRGFCISATPITEIQICLNGILVRRETPTGGYPLKQALADEGWRKFVFNAWIDFSSFAPGQYQLDVRAFDLHRRMVHFSQSVALAGPLREADFPDSDALTSGPPDDTPLDIWINGRPSMVRQGRRALLKTPPRTVLVQRADQLGDFIVSVPAIRRLRALFPDARFVGLLSPANADLARSLRLFDAIETVDFRDDPLERRRVLSLDDQAHLRERLSVHNIDLAIDLSEAASSRPLLLLSGAPFLVGFRSGEVPALTVDLEGNTHDRMDYHEVVPHTNKLLGLVEWLAALTRSEPNVALRPDLDRSLLEQLGLAADDSFVVLHDGARLQFSRWPHYQRLAGLLLNGTSHKVVMLSDDPALRQTLTKQLASSPRFILLDRRLDFDQFDALVSFCAAFVGNDSGPKHLASFRGAKVVSLHMARNNWNEWGQESGGYIVSRRVPCAGCLIHHEPEECGKVFVCMTGIAAEEVYRAVIKAMAEPEPGLA